MSLADRLPKTQRDRRALAVLGITLAVGLFFRFGVLPYRTALADTRMETERARQLLKRDLGLLAQSDQLAPAFKSAESALMVHTRRLFEEQDAAIAKSELQQYVNGIADANHVLMQLSDTRNTTISLEGIRILPVNIAVESDLDGLLSFLNDLETGPRLVNVENLTIMRIEPGPEVTPGAEALSIRATVSGYTLTDSVPAPPPAGRGAPRGRVGAPAGGR